jgi:hypothetical protein
MDTMCTGRCVAPIFALILVARASPAAAQETAEPVVAPAAPEARAEVALRAETDAVRAREEAVEKKEAEHEKALSSFVQLLGDAKAQTTTGGESSAAFGGGILYRGEDQSILVLARTDATVEALDSQAERGALLLTPESAGQPSFEFDWRIYFLCMVTPLRWQRDSCSDVQRDAAQSGARRGAAAEARPHDPSMLDVGLRFYMAGGTADWALPAADPDDAVVRRAGVLAYGVDVAVRREFIKGPGNYVALEAGVGGTVRNLIGDLTGQQSRPDLEAFLGTDDKFYIGPELYLGLTINALNVGIALPVFFEGEIDGFSGGQLLVTAIVRDGPKLVIPE